MNKKNYVSPVAEVLVYAPVLLVGSAVTSGGDEWVEGDGNDQLSSDYRSDWDDIWSYM